MVVPVVEPPSLELVASTTSVVPLLSVPLPLESLFDVEPSSAAVLASPVVDDAGVSIATEVEPRSACITDGSKQATGSATIRRGIAWRSIAQTWHRPL